MMRQLLAIAVNDLRVEFSSRSVWISFVILPLLFTAIIGVATGSAGSDTDADDRIPIALVNQDGGPVAAAFAEALANSEVVRPEPNEEAQALAELEAAMVEAMVVLPQGFSEGLLAGESVEIPLHLSPTDNSSLAAREAVLAAASRVSRELLAARFSVEEAEALRPFVDEEERDAYYSEALDLAEQAADSPPLQVKTTQAAESATPRIATGFSQSSPGQLVTWGLATLLSGAVLLVSERTMGTLRRLVTMPTGKGVILAGKILGRFTLGVIQMAIMIVFGQLILGVNWGNSPAAMAMVALSFGLAATAFGIFIATVVRTENQADGMVTLATFLLAPLGGAWFPLEITPVSFQTVAQVLPTTWAMRGFTDVIVRGQGPQGVLLECAVLLGFATVFFALGIWRFKYE